MAFNYKGYLQSKLEQLTDLSVKVVDALDFSLDSDLKVIIKYLTGTLYKGTKIQPVQLYVLSSNVEEAKMLMETFAETYSQSRERLDFKYFKQTYTTLVILDNFMQIKNKQISALYISGMLTILEGVIDINKVRIGDEDLTLIEAQEHYVVQATTKKVAQEELSYNKKQTASYSLQLTIKNDNSVFCNNLKQIRHGLISGNTQFKVKIYYDNEVNPIEHNMIILDHSLTTSEANIPIVSVVLGVDE
jgi:hypothetical protein